MPARSLSPPRAPAPRLLRPRPCGGRWRSPRRPPPSWSAGGCSRTGWPSADSRADRAGRSSLTPPGRSGSRSTRGGSTSRSRGSPRRCGRRSWRRKTSASGATTGSTRSPSAGRRCTTCSAGRRPRGASTITQQLARTLFLSRERTLGRKLREAALALLLEALLPKERILELYSTACPLGALHGVEAFARGTFGKPGGRPDPGRGGHGRRDHPRALGHGAARALRAGAGRGRAGVLARMRAEGLVTPAQERGGARRASPARGRPAPGGTCARGGRRISCGAPSARRPATRTRRGGACGPRSPRPPAGGRGGGGRGIARLRRPGLQAALVALDPQNGGVLAIVGGADTRMSTYNRAVLSSAASRARRSSPSSTPRRSSAATRP